MKVLEQPAHSNGIAEMDIVGRDCGTSYEVALTAPVQHRGTWNGEARSFSDDKLSNKQTSVPSVNRTHCLETAGGCFPILKAESAAALRVLNSQNGGQRVMSTFLTAKGLLQSF